MKTQQITMTDNFTDTYNGIIIKAIDGFFYVQTDDGLFECKSRGLFRKTGIKPVPGDRVTVQLSSTDGNVISEILPRSSLLNRPALANIDRLFIISSVSSPKPNKLVIDRMTAIALNRGIESVVVFSKSDLGDCDELIDTYKKAGIESFSVSAVNGEGIDLIKSMLNGHISAFTGNSGVGKSSLLNCLFPELKLETSEISTKLGRGKHTTRESELFKVDGGFVADTPGFSALQFEGEDIMLKENVAFGFKEFLPYLGKCKFSTCRHINDKGCAILKAVEDGVISQSRHESYISLYNEAREVNSWELNK